MTEERKLPRVLTPKMVADLWLCSERHVRNLINRGELNSFQLGGKLLRIRAQDVVEFEKRNATPAWPHESPAVPGDP
ncbi:helix-turn-helix domain-containing protein [Pseudaminobacter sp. NGMCC 1.201702]|jgi:excisionase family DNA binding protein|uniref:helix-turn-helix domain-containing protein n=1 Tax=Pseudaminobacter sp. NGMCC 1.201702 TaxID=3391825 RepID=UPI0039F0529D